MMTPLQDTYENAECPDCAEPILDTYEQGDECSNCGHVFWLYRQTDDETPQ